MKFNVSEEERIEILKSHSLLLEQKRRGKPKNTKLVNVRKPLPGDNTRISKPNIPDHFYAEKMEACHAFYNNSTLKKALDWWRNWLKNPITKEKFRKNWKMDSYTLRDVFKDYENRLNEVKLVYVWEPKMFALAYVKGSPLGFQPPGYVGKVFVNCAESRESEEEAINTLIHEIQHILYYVKPLHPKQKIEKSLDFKPSDQDSIWKKLSSILGSNQESSSPEPNKKTDMQTVMSDFKKEGVKDKVIDRYYSSYVNNVNRGKIDYAKETTEILSRLYEVRRVLNLKPGQDITIQQFIKLMNEENPEAHWVVMSIIHSGKTIREVLNIFNSYAKNNNYNPQNKNQTLQV